MTEPRVILACRLASAFLACGSPPVCAFTRINLVCFRASSGEGVLTQPMAMRWVRPSGTGTDGWSSPGRRPHTLGHAKQPVEERNGGIVRAPVLARCGSR